MTEKQQEYLNKILDKESPIWKHQRHEIEEKTAYMVDFLIFMGVLDKEGLKEKYEQWLDGYTTLFLTKSVEKSSDADIKTADLFTSMFGNIF